MGLLVRRSRSIPRALNVEGQVPKRLTKARPASHMPDSSAFAKVPSNTGSNVSGGNKLVKGHPVRRNFPPTPLPQADYRRVFSDGASRAGGSADMREDFPFDTLEQEYDDKGSMYSYEPPTEYSYYEPPSEYSVTRSGYFTPQSVYSAPRSEYFTPQSLYSALRSEYAMPASFHPSSALYAPHSEAYLPPQTIYSHHTGFSQQAIVPTQQPRRLRKSPKA